MTTQPYYIERLIPPVSDFNLHALAQLLVDTVTSGASVSFLAPLTLERAEDWWRKTTSNSSPAAIFLVAYDSEGDFKTIVGTVQLQPAWAPNQPHRAEIAKLMVHSRSRRTGLGKLLMQSIEAEARRAGFRLLTLDTKRGTEAEQLYLHHGWVRVGSIPNFAYDPDGKSMHDTVIFYKTLDQAPESLVGEN